MMMNAARRSKAPHSDDVSIGARVRARRLMINLTQKKLAALIGVTYQQVQKYEKGANRISGSRIKQIAAVLECEPGQLFGGSHTNSGASPFLDVAAELCNTRQSRNLLDAFKRVPDDALRSAVVSLVQSMADKDKIKCAGVVTAAAMLATSLCFGCLIDWPHSH